MQTDKRLSAKSFFSIKDKGKQQAGTKLGYTSSNRKLDGGETVLISGVKPEQLSNAINTNKYNIKNFFPLSSFQFIQRKFILIHLIVILISIGIHDDENFSIDRVQLFAVFLSPILISYSVYVFLLLLIERNKSIFDQHVNERQSLVFNKHRNKLFEADQTVIEQQVNLSDQRKWKDIEVGDIIIIYKDEHCPCEVLVLDFQGENCILDMQFINGNTVYKKIKPLKVTRSKQSAKNKGSQIDFRKMLKGMIEYSRNEYDEVKGYIKLKQDPQVEQFSDENIISRSAIIKQDWVFAIALYTGLECKEFKHQKSNLNKEKESFFLNKIEFFCLFHYLLLIPIIVQKLIFQASSTCYNEVENSERFYFKQFNLRQLFITLTDCLPLFPIVIYIIVDAISIFEVYLQNYEVITSEDDTSLRLKYLSEVKNSNKPIQNNEIYDQQNTHSQQQNNKLNINANSEQPNFYQQNSAVQNNRDKKASIVKNPNNQNKKNKCNEQLNRLYFQILQFLIRIKKYFQRNFTEKLIYPHFRTREAIPIADLSVTSHVIIGKTNVISYPYSSEVCKILFGEIQYKFQPDKIAQKYNDFMIKYQTLKQKLSESKQIKRLGLNFKGKRQSEKMSIPLSMEFGKSGFSVSNSDDKMALYNNLAISEFQDGTDKESMLQICGSNSQIKINKSNPFQIETKSLFKRSQSLNTLHESPEFRSNNRPNINLSNQVNNGAGSVSNQKKVADSIILEESNMSIKTKAGANNGGNSNRNFNIFEQMVTRSERHQSQISNLIKFSDIHTEDIGFQNFTHNNESSINTKRQRLSLSLNQINPQFNNNLNKIETASSFNKINHQNSLTETGLKGDLSSRDRINILQKQKSHNSDLESASNISNNQINSLQQYQKNSINTVCLSRFEAKQLNSGRSSRSKKPKLSIECDEDIPDEKDSSFKKEYMNILETTNIQSPDFIQQREYQQKQLKNKSQYKPNNLNTISIPQPETMRHLMEELQDDGEVKYFPKPLSQNSRVLGVLEYETSSISSSQCIIEQDKQNQKDDLKNKQKLQTNNVIKQQQNNNFLKENNHANQKKQTPLEDINDFNDIPSENLSEKMKTKQDKAILNKQNSTGSFSWEGEINSEMSQSQRLKNNIAGGNMNSIHYSAHKKFMNANMDKGTPTSDEKDPFLLQNTSTKKLLASNQSTIYRQRSQSQQLIPRPFATIQEQEEEQNKTPLPKSQQRDMLSPNTNESENQLSLSRKQQNDNNYLLQKDVQRRFSLEDDQSRSSHSHSIRFGIASKSNNSQANINQQSVGFSRRSSLIKQNNGLTNSEETPKNIKKSLKIDLSKIEDSNDQKLMNIINKQEISLSNQLQNSATEQDGQKSFPNQRASIESPQLGKYMNTLLDKQESGRKSKSGSVKDFIDGNSVDSYKRNRQYQLSIHSRDIENQKIERKPGKQFTFQTRQMASTSIKYDKPTDLMKSHFQENSQQQILQTVTLGQVSESLTHKKLEQLYTSGNEKPQFPFRNYKKSFQSELLSSDNPFENQDQIGQEDDDDYEDELNEDDYDENEDDQKSGNQQKINRFNVDSKLGVFSDINSKINDSINEVKSDINQRNRCDTHNFSIEKKNQTPKRKKSQKHLNKSTLPKLHIQRESLEMNQLSARLNLSPTKKSSTRFFGKKQPLLKQSTTIHSDSNKSSRSTSVNFNRLQGFQDHSIPKDMDKFLEHYIRENSSNRKQIRNSLKCMVLCHQTVTKFDIDKKQPNHTHYDEEEEMILRFTRNLGYDFKVQNIKINKDNQYKQEYIIQMQSKVKKYEIIAFHRKKFRFSILVKRKNGADLIMREELKSVPLYLDFQRDLMAKIIHKNMQNGFRSVLISKCSLDHEQTERFVNQLDNLQTNIVKEREAIENLFGIYEERENKMQFVILLGVREKLRENSEILLDSLYNNKIKTWMLTGEQYTRAISSAYLSKIVKPEDSKNQNNLINIHFESSDYDDIKFIIRRNLEKVQVYILGEDQEKNSAFHSKDQHTKFQRKKSNVRHFATNQLEQQIQFQIFIKGDVLKIILEDPVYLKSHFLFLCHFCKGFVAYEVESDTKQMLVNALKEQEQQNRFLAITNDRGLSNIAHFSVEMENPQNSSQFVADACIDGFKDLYKLIFLHGRRQADFINIILNIQVYRQMLFYIVILITEDSNCSEGENPMNQIEITVFNYILNFLSIIPLFIWYFNPKDPAKLKKDEDENLKYYSIQYQTTRNFWSKTQITTYCKLLIAALIQALIIFFSMDQILQYIQKDGKLIGFEEIRMIIFIMIMVVTQFQIIYFTRITKALNVIYQIFIFFISTVIYLAWKSNDNSMFMVLAELFHYPSFFISFIIFGFISCLIFEILHLIFQIMPYFLQKNLEVIEKAINYFENNYSNLRASRLAESKREVENTQTNHLTLLGIIRQYFKGQSEIDEIVLSMMNTGIDNIHTGISKYNQKFDNPEFEQKYIKRTIGQQINFSKIISLIILFTFDIFLLVIIILDDDYANSQKVIMITFIAIVCVFTFMKWYRYEQFFIVFNFALIVARVGYLIAAIQIINDYDNFLIMLVFMYILYFIQLVRMDIVIAVYTFFGLYDSINFVIGIQSEGYGFSKEYLSFYIINALSLIAAFTYLLMAQKYSYGLMDRQQYLSTNKLQLEMQKFNEVLSILLPKFIRDQIQSDNQSVVKIENQVSIIFCDIYNFDDIIAKKNVEVIKLLDNLYRAFDILCNLNNLQKIETVGKTYMACGGIVQNKLQQREGQYNEFNEVKCAINFAFEILEYSSTLTFGDDGEKIQLKIGIHFGNVIAGVIGYHKPQFSLIGDTVNTTSRVCSTSDPGTVTLSLQAYERVKECDVKVQQIGQQDKFRINEAKQKKVEAKGKGELITYQVQYKKNGSPSPTGSFLQGNKGTRDRQQGFALNTIKLHESPQSENIPNNTDQNSVGDQNFDSNEKNNFNSQMNPHQQIQQKQALLLQEQLLNQEKEEKDIVKIFQNLSFKKQSSGLTKQQSQQNGQDQKVNNQQTQIEINPHNVVIDMTISRNVSNIQITPKGQRMSGNSNFIFTPEGMLKSNASKMSISNQNGANLGNATINTLTQGELHTINENDNLGVSSLNQTNNPSNNQSATNSNKLHSPHIQGFRADKSELNANELVSNVDVDQKTKINTLDQQKSHNFSTSHFQELKSEGKSNIDTQISKLPFTGNLTQFNDDKTQIKGNQNGGSGNVNGQGFSNQIIQKQLTPQQLSPKISQIDNQQNPNIASLVAQKVKQNMQQQKNNNLPKNIASLIMTINNNNNNNESEDPSNEQKKQGSKHQSSADSRKDTSNNTISKLDDILPPFTHSGSVHINQNNTNSQRGSTNSTHAQTLQKMDSKNRKISIFNPTNHIGLFLDENHLKRVNSKDKSQKQKLGQGVLENEKAKQAIFGNVHLVQNTLNTPQSKSSIQKLHKIRHLQGFSDLISNQPHYESSGGGTSSNKIQGNSQPLSSFKKSNEKKEILMSSKSHTEIEILDSSIKSHGTINQNNEPNQIQQMEQIQQPNNNTPQKRSLNLNKNIKHTENHVHSNKNTISNIQNFLSKGIGGQNDQNNEQTNEIHQNEGSPPPPKKRKSFFTNNGNLHLIQTPPFKPKSNHMINMNNGLMVNGKSNGGGSINLNKNINGGQMYQSVSSSMQNIPDLTVKQNINNTKNQDKKIAKNSQMNQPKYFRRGSLAVGNQISSINENKFIIQNTINKQPINQQNSLQDNKSAHSKNSSQNQQYKKNYKQCISQEEKNSDNLFQNCVTTQQNNPTTDVIQTNPTNGNAQLNQINIQLETIPIDNQARRGSTTNNKHIQEFNANNNNISGTQINHQNSSETTPKNKGKFTPQGANQRSSSNTNNQSLNEAPYSKGDQNQQTGQGVLNTFAKNPDQVDNNIQATQLKNQALEKRVTEYTIRSKTNTKSSKQTHDNKSPALTNLISLQANSQIQLDNNIDSISEEELKDKNDIFLENFHLVMMEFRNSMNS